MFVDDNGNVHEADIEALAQAGVTQGCNPTNDRFCPDNSLTRGEAAAFFSRGLSLPASSVDFFVDDDDSIFEGNINSVALDEITRGCSADGTLYCPDETIDACSVRLFRFPRFSVSAPVPGAIASPTMTAASMKPTSNDLRRQGSRWAATPRRTTTSARTPQ